MSDRRPHDVYRNLLLRERHGYPLWIPESDYNLPDVYRDKGVSVGDLGILTDDGGFDFLFNVCAEADDPVNCGRVPPQFQPLRISCGSSHAIRKIPYHCRNSSITSAHVSKTEFIIEGSAEMACVDVLPFSSSYSLIRFLLSARLSPVAADLSSAFKVLKQLSYYCRTAVTDTTQRIVLFSNNMPPKMVIRGIYT